MISHLGDHYGLPFHFGVIRKSTPFSLVTQFDGDSTQSQMLCKAMIRLEQTILASLFKRHNGGLQPCPQQVYNDLKSNNVLLKKRGKDWNPVIILRNKWEKTIEQVIGINPILSKEKNFNNLNDTPRIARKDWPDL